MWWRARPARRCPSDHPLYIIYVYLFVSGLARRRALNHVCLEPTVVVFYIYREDSVTAPLFVVLRGLVVCSLSRESEIRTVLRVLLAVRACLICFRARLVFGALSGCLVKGAVRWGVISAPCLGLLIARRPTFARAAFGWRSRAASMQQER